jgi:hypothetical protein
MTATKTNVGENVAYSIDEKTNTLTITVDLDYRAGDKPAEGKKTIRVASTLGNVELPGGVRLGLNAYVYPER